MGHAKYFFISLLCPLSVVHGAIGPTQTTELKTTNETHKSIGVVRRFLDNFHTVEKNRLYRCAQLSPRHLKRYIEKYGIKTVINLRGKNENKKWWRRERKTVEQAGARFYNIPMTAKKLTDKNKLQYLLYLYDNAPRPILIHCKAGMDRTGEAAAIWKLEKEHKEKKIALRQLSIKYGHVVFRRPSKTELINRWQGRSWLAHEYNPE